jgi:hypothetical protein
MNVNSQFVIFGDPPSRLSQATDFEQCWSSSTSDTNDDCDEVQGYLRGRPAFQEVIEDELARIRREPQ